MISATKSDKDKVVDILSAAFNDNKSVNYIIKQDAKRTQRIRSLMEYSFDVCYATGKVFIADDKNACALVVFPGKKKWNFRSFCADVKFILSSTGIGNIKKAMTREQKIKALQPAGEYCYIWFIAVDPAVQGRVSAHHFLQNCSKNAGKIAKLFASKLLL